MTDTTAGAFPVPQIAPPFRFSNATTHQPTRAVVFSLSLAGPPAVAACARVAEVRQLTVGGVGGGVAAAHVADVSVGAAARFSVVMRDATAFPHTVGPSEHPSGWKILSSDAEHTDAKMEGDTLVVRTLTDGSLIVKVQSLADPEVSHYVVVQVCNGRPSPSPSQLALFMIILHRRERLTPAGVLLEHFPLASMSLTSPKSSWFVVLLADSRGTCCQYSRFADG